MTSLIVEQQISSQMSLIANITSVLLLKLKNNDLFSERLSALLRRLKAMINAAKKRKEENNETFGNDPSVLTLFGFLLRIQSAIFLFVQMSRCYVSSQSHSTDGDHFKATISHHHHHDHSSVDAPDLDGRSSHTEIAMIMEDLKSVLSTSNK